MATLVRIAMLVIGITGGNSGIAASLADAVPIAPEPFFANADYGALKLSPSGTRIGALIPVRGRVCLAVMDLDRNKIQVVGTVVDGDVTWFEWVNDSRLIFGGGVLDVSLQWRTGTGIVAVNVDGTDQRGLYARGLHSVLRDGSDDILVIPGESKSRSLDLSRMNTKTGRAQLRTLGKPGDVVRYVTDRVGAVRAAVTDEGSGVWRVFWRPDEEAKWVELLQYRLGEPYFFPVDFDGDGSLIVSSNIGRETMALHRYDTAKKMLAEELAAHPQADLTGGLVFDQAKNRLVGLIYDGPLPGAVWFDEDRARTQKAIDNALPGRVNQLVGYGGRHALIYSFADTDPGTYYLLDVEKSRLQFVAAQRKAIKPEAMFVRKPVRYLARDGLEIPGYLTLPKGAEPKNLPLVLLVHGGPWMRGAHWWWNPEVAYLVSLGYAVLEPEFRGTTGWGAKLYLAGWKQWGRAMQDDLNDGVDWLARQGTIDPKRVCIMGGSYGGYAVMMALARDPERWRCGINFAGVTDINLIFDAAWSPWARSDWIDYGAKEMIGDPDKDHAMFKAASPIEHSQRIRAPVLLAYGRQDSTVPIIHGERMRDALARQGSAFEWIVYEEEGHGLLLEKSRFDFYTRVGKFLLTHNPPN